MPYIVSPNMNLQIPSVGTQPNPDAALNVNTSLTTIDGHDHTPGNGAQLTPDSLDINADLDINQNNLLDVRSVRFDPQASPISDPADLGCIYVAGVDLYFNDVNGNDIRLTQGGAIAGAAGSISGLVAPASASYDSFSETFVWESDVNKPAAMDSGSVTIREEVANGFGVTLEASPSITADYTLTMPAALPATTNAITLTDTSGGQAYLSKGAADEVLRMDGSGTNVGYGLITTDNVAAATLTQYNMGALGNQDTASSGSFSTTSTSFIDVPNLEVTITTTGRPVIVMFVPDGTGNPASLFAPASGGLILQLLENGGTIYTTAFINGGSGSTQLPVGFTYFGAPAAGSNTYKLQVKSTSGATISVIDCQLIAYEL